MSKKLAKVWRRLSFYFRHEFPEMVWPSSLPDPPELTARAQQQRRLTLTEHSAVWGRAWREYAGTWLPEAEPRAEGGGTLMSHGLSSSDEGLGMTEGQKRNGGETAATPAAATTADEFPSGERLFLRRAVMSRLSAYAGSLREFVEGYREGVRGATRSSGGKD